MVGNDRSGTVDNNLNLLKAVELALTGGKDLIPSTDPMTGKTEKIRQDGPATGDADAIHNLGRVLERLCRRRRGYIIKKCVELYETSESIRARFFPTPYLSCLVKGCAEKGLDITQGGARDQLHHPGGGHLRHHGRFAAGDQIPGLRQKSNAPWPNSSQALKDNWEGHEVLQAKAQNRAPKYGRDDDEADDMAQKVMELWSDETWKHRTKSTGRQFRPGMLSWNYWVGDGFIMAASADGRPKGQFLSNAICPVQRRRHQGPHGQRQFRGQGPGRQGRDGTGRLGGYLNACPTAPATPSPFIPSMLQRPGAPGKFKAFLRAIAKTAAPRCRSTCSIPTCCGTPRGIPRTTGTCWSASPATTPILHHSAGNCRTKSSPG